MCELMTNVARALSLKGSTSSLITDRISNLERIGSVSSTLSLKFLDGSYLPYTGFAAAMTEHQAYNDVTIPALEILMLCYSIASWIEVLS